MKILLAICVFLGFACVTSAQLQNVSWPSSRANLLNTGLGTGSGAFSQVKWKFRFSTAKNFIRTPAVDKNGVVYVATTAGSVVAINGKTAATIWTVTTGTTSFSSPAIDVNGTVYVGDDEGQLFALQGISGSTLWVTNLSSNAAGPPAIGPDGTLYVVCNDGKLYAVNSTNGTTKWSFDSKVGFGKTAANCCPAITSGGTIYFTAGNVLDAVNTGGTEVWSSAPDSSLSAILSTPAVGADGTIFVCSTTFGAFAVSPKDGSNIWSFPGAGGVQASPAIGPDGSIYVASFDGDLYSLQPGTGLMNWTYSTTNTQATYSNPSVASDGVVYFPSDQTLFAIDGATGLLDWSYANDDHVYDPVIGADGSVFFGSDDTYLYCLNVGLYPISLSVNPSAVVGGFPSTGTVTLSGPATANGITVALSSNTGGVQVPNFVTVPVGQTSATFPITTPVVVATFSATITATYNGISQKAILTLNPYQLAALSIAPSSLAGGATAVGTATLNTLAPPGGLIVSLAGNSLSMVVPGSVTVPAGQISANFKITTIPVTAPAYTVVTGTLNGKSQQQAFLTIDPSQLESLAFDPSTVAGGVPSTGIVTLTGIAPTGGFKVLFSNSSSSAGIPAFLMIPAGASSGTFPAKTAQVTKQTVVVVVATMGSITKAASLTIVAPVVKSILLAPSSVTGGTASVGTVTLTGPANKAGLSVKLASNSKSSAVPATVFVASGKTSATFNVRTIAVAAVTTATITGTSGSVSASNTLTVNPPLLISVTIAPAKFARGKSATGTVKISGAAPTGGMVIALTNTTSGVTVPSKATITAGRTSATFTIKTSKTAVSGPSTISATQSGTTKTTTITLT